MMTMTEGSKYSTMRDGRLCFWQVFELMQEFKDRPADASGDRVFSVSLYKNGVDSLAIVVGRFPEHIRQALLEYRARAAYTLRSLTGEYSDMTIEEQDAAISALEGQLNLDDLGIGDRIYLTMEMRRPLDIEINSSLRYLWEDTAADDSCRAAVEGFAEEAAPVLDSALAWLLPAMGQPPPTEPSSHTWQAGIPACSGQGSPGETTPYDDSLAFGCLDWHLGAAALAGATGRAVRLSLAYR